MEASPSSATAAGGKAGTYWPNNKALYLFLHPVKVCVHYTAGTWWPDNKALAQRVRGLLRLLPGGEPPKAICCSVLHFVLFDLLVREPQS